MNIGFFNNKGGVGKSTLSVHAAFRAMDKGVSVQFIDADPQDNGIKWVTQDTWDGNDYVNMDNIVATKDLSAVNHWDGINIIDCPPEYTFLDKLKENNIDLDILIVPVKSRFSLDGAMHVIAEVKQLKMKDTRLIFVINMVDASNTEISKSQINEVKQINVEMFKYAIPRNKYIEMAEMSCKSVFNIPYSMRSSAVQLITHFSDWVLSGCSDKFTYGNKNSKRLESYEV